MNGINNTNFFIRLLYLKIKQIFWKTNRCLKLAYLRVFN